MRIPVVRFGDPTTTGGKVHAFNKHMMDNGKAIALHGDRATCRNCTGTWPIVGTGYRMRNDGRPVVLQGDNVLCPCGQNRVIAGPDAKCFYHRAPGETHARSTVTNQTAAALSSETYDEQFVLRDANGRPLADTYYTVRMPDSRLIHGTTDGAGRTDRHATEGAKHLRIYLGHREIL